jgi:hypothetical protein
MPPDFLSLRIGARFLVVTMMPNLAFVALTGGLVVAGAPTHRPSLAIADARLAHLSIGTLILLGIGVLVLTFAMHPLNYPLVQLVEGYWSDLPGGHRLRLAAAAPAAGRLRALKARQDELANRDANADKLEMAEIVETVRWLPEEPAFVLPTQLGNVLRAGEERAGSRYEYRSGTIWPRLVQLLPEQMLSQVNDLRNQLDASIRLCVLGLVAVPVTVALLLRYDIWLLVPIGCYLFAWMSYRAAVAAAKRFSVMLEVAFDLHHLALWDAMSLPRPKDLRDVLEQAPVLSRMLADEYVQPNDYRYLVYERKDAK